MLGEQPWAKPNTFDTFNTGARLDYDLPHSWRAFAAGELQPFADRRQRDLRVRMLADEAAMCQWQRRHCARPISSAPDGSYDIYDYRDPGELRIDAEAEAMVTGHVKTGAIAQDLTAGGELFLRSVQQPGFYRLPNPSSDGIVQDGAVYTYVGSENIYQPIAAVSHRETRIESAGPRTLWEDNHQSAAVVQDRIHLPGRIQLIAGGRYDSLRDHNYSLTATSPGQRPTSPTSPSGCRSTRSPSTRYRT